MLTGMKEVNAMSTEDIRWELLGSAINTQPLGHYRIAIEYDPVPAVRWKVIPKARPSWKLSAIERARQGLEAKRVVAINAS